MCSTGTGAGAIFAASFAYSYFKTELSLAIHPNFWSNRLRLGSGCCFG
jgi:hypothetical protein